MAKRLTTEQKVDRTSRRAKVREAAVEKVAALRAWREDRAAAAEKRAKGRAAAKANAKPDGSRGVHRVPAHLQGLAVTEERHLYGKRDTDRKYPLAQPEDLHPSGNYADRRARGHRGHPAKTRRRDMPRAVERRLERARRAWLDNS